MKFREFAPYFEEVFSAYELTNDTRHTIASIKFLALLYQLRDFTTVFQQWEQGFATPQQILLRKFVQLVNNFYIEKSTIEEYALMLHVTPNYLSQSIKSASGRNALSYINERLLDEAKSIIQFTGFDISEIAYQLNFSDQPTSENFLRNIPTRLRLNSEGQKTDNCKSFKRKRQIARAFTVCKNLPLQPSF